MKQVVMLSRNSISFLATFLQGLQDIKIKMSLGLVYNIWKKAITV